MVRLKFGIGINKRFFSYLSYFSCFSASNWGFVKIDMVVIKNAGNIRIKTESKIWDMINIKELLWWEKMVKNEEI